MKTDGTNPPGQGIFGLIDINCHILPGTEDGPDNFREAAEMLRIAYDEGIRTIVATPPYNKKNPIMDGDKLQYGKCGCVTRRLSVHGSDVSGSTGDRG